ncbi:SapC family protein [Altererythrobacter sp. CC-YST694]|uniref:SapC family protein n=1 Tax=Altererythrobacter sp. CC-YST694 TaxID=2755038 RepID=UPI001D02D5DE|nr:SapC family protein [Altererythrobacter sp. CC-YST694]MCB5424225.1 SapC family protein [Altererythrobacter sp. CC-YST694]
MATAPNPSLPLFYQDLMPLNRRDHEKWRSHRSETANWLIDQHAVPLTAEEFSLAQRFFPIVFSSGERPVPLALFGLNEGVNVYVDAEGVLTTDIYMPAYVRRYPFLLAKLDANTDVMSLCFDPSSKLLGDFEDGDALFEGEEPAEFTKGVMQFCERFEEAGVRTQAFVDELLKHDLLMDGEVAITREGSDQPFIYRGFKMINQEKLRELRGDLLRAWNQNGILALIYAHIMSLDLLRVIFGLQTAQGKGPGAATAQTVN